MSFYQPSLSLYDVLSALASQNERGDQPQPPQAGQARGFPGPFPQGRGRSTPHHHHRDHPHPHPHPHPLGHSHGHGPGHRGHPMGPHGAFPPFGFPSGGDPFQSAFGGAPYGFSRMPQQGYYYSPQYAYEDDEDENPEEQDEDEDMGVGKKEEPEEESKDYPSYYHDESGKYNRGYDNKQPTLQDILNSLMGGAPVKTASGYADSNDEEGNEEPETPAEEKETPVADDEEKQTSVVDDKEKGDIATPEPEHAATSTGKLEKPTRSFAHLSAPTPIPDPLQISNPETRLDLPFSPEVNIYDLDEEYVVVLALPGANSKSFKIDYHPSSHELLVKGKVIDRLGIDEQYLKITEIKYGAFERTVKFPVLPRIKDDEIKATYTNGLLQIKVPKQEITEKPQPKKRINIEDIPDAELEFEENPNPVTKI